MLSQTKYYRDIKPENILHFPIPLKPNIAPAVRPNDLEDKTDEGHFIAGLGSGGIGLIKIADFGLARVCLDSQITTTKTTTGGTTAYNAPEVIRGEASNKSVDLWSLGCVLYILLCGFQPFYGANKPTLEEMIVRGQFSFLSPWWDDISDSAQDLISQLLVTDPAARFTIEDFFHHPWISGRQVPTTPAPGDTATLDWKEQR